MMGTSGINKSRLNTERMIKSEYEQYLVSGGASNGPAALRENDSKVSNQSAR